MLEKFSFELHTTRLKREEITLEKKDSEQRNHVVLKLLAYALFYEPGLKIEVTAGMHYKPDLMVSGEHEHGVPKLWIDCGKVTLKKVETLTRKLRSARLIFIKETKRELETFKRLVHKKVEGTDNLEFLAFEAGFVDGMACALEKSNYFTLYEIKEETIGIALKDQIFETDLYR